MRLPVTYITSQPQHDEWLRIHAADINVGFMLVYLNNTFVEAENALVPVADRGFRYGDGLFETLPFTAAGLYQWPFHEARLAHGLHALAIPLDVSPLAWLSQELIRRNGLTEGLLRIAVSRGAGGRGYLPPENLQPTLVIEAHPLPAPPASPISLLLSRYEKFSPRALPTEYKISQGLQSTLARMEAAKAGAFDALLLDANGHIAETSSANLFWLKDARLFTPSLATGALRGATRHAVLQFSPWPVVEIEAPLQTIALAEAVVMTNSPHGILPIASLSPQGFHWNSDALAQELQSRLRQDRNAAT